MNRITYMELAGKQYPLSFSLAASKAIAAKYGDITKIGEVLSFEKFGEKEVDTIIDIITILISQGAAYKNMFEADLPCHEKSDIRDGRYYAPSREEIESAIGFGDLTEVLSKITECLTDSTKTEIEAEMKTKNTEAPKEALYT